MPTKMHYHLLLDAGVAISVSKHDMRVLFRLPSWMLSLPTHAKFMDA